MLTLAVRIHSFVRCRSRRCIQVCGLVLASLMPIVPAKPLSAEIYYIDLINVTFTAPCIGGGTCTEVYSGSGLYDLTNNTATGITSTLTGTLSGSLDAYGSPVCTAPGCVGSSAIYDPNHLPGYNPIEIGVVINDYNAPTPELLQGGPDGTVLFVPANCGGDQPLCGLAGSFPGNPNLDYLLTSGEYTSVDLGPSPTPEPAPALLVFSGTAVCAAFRRFRRSAKNTL